MNSIVNDALDLSKIEAGKMDMECVSFSLHKLALSLASGYKTRALAQGIALHVDVSRRVPHTLYSDPTRIRQVLSNGRFYNTALCMRVRAYEQDGRAGGSNRRQRLIFVFCLFLSLCVSVCSNETLKHFFVHVFFILPLFFFLLPLFPLRSARVAGSRRPSLQPTQWARPLQRRVDIAVRGGGVHVSQCSLCLLLL